MGNSFYSEEELRGIGFGKVGNNVLISRKASIYSPELMSIGDDVRIDDFCILSGKIALGNYIHIAAYCALYGGKEGIKLGDFSGISARSVVYAESDDFTGGSLTNPMVPDEYRHVIRGGVSFGKHALIGTGCTILPGVEVGEGTSVGCMSLVNKSLGPWGIYAGIPCRFLHDRDKDLLRMEAELLARRKK